MNGTPHTAPQGAVRRWLPLLLPLGLYLAAVAGFLAYSTWARTGFPLDDAWIHRVYAQAFSRGQGFAYNDGVQEAGCTSPLWIALSAPAHWLGLLGGVRATVLGVKALGIVLGAFGVCCVAGIARRTGSAPAAAAAGCVYAVEPRLAFSALSGMETTLLAALWLGTAWSLLARRDRLAVVLLGLAPLARPEASILTFVGLVVLIVTRGTRDRLWRRPWTWVWLVAPALAWAVFCRSVNGHWLPNTFYVKAQPFHLGVEPLHVAWQLLTLRGWAALPWFVAGLAGCAFWLGARRDRRASAAAVLLLVAPAVYLVGVAGSRKIVLDGYYWTRYADPASLVLTAAFALALAGAWTVALRRDGRRLRPARALLGLVVAAVLLLSLPAMGRGYAERRARLSSDSRAIERINVAAGRWIAEHTPPDAVVGVNDAGAIRFFGGRRTIDLLGLNDASIAFSRADRRKVLDELDYVAVFPSWGRRLLDAFEVRRVFEIPREEYTICNCPSQTIQVVAERKRALR